MRPAVFLDRDNTLIANDGDLGDPAQVRLLDGVATGLKALHDAGYELIVVTNQAGVARGVFTEDDVDEVHQRIDRLVEEATETNGLITRFYYCPYHPTAPLKSYRRDHPWRKPNPGMLIQASRDLDLDLARSWMVGDQTRDVQAGKSAGCRTILLGDAEPSENGRAATLASGSFPDAVQAILSRTPPRLRERTDPKAPPPGGGDEALRSAVVDLADEFRAERARRNDFTPMRLAAGLVQLAALLLALLGLLQMDSSDAYFRWMAGAALVELLVIALLVADQR